MSSLSSDLEQRLIQLAEAIVDHRRAKIIIPAQAKASGFWFGGGNMLATDDGYFLVGRYRNHGDSRTGVQLGQRGLELAVFRAPMVPASESLQFTKCMHWEKADLDVDDLQVLSMEGSALRVGDDGWELFVSSEKKDIGYPDELAEFLKPGTGVWTIDHLAAPTLEGLRDATPRTVLASEDPRHLHVKDPNLHMTRDGDLQLIFCTHPFSWTSSNSAYSVRSPDGGSFAEPVYDEILRGTTWDVAMTRVTCVVDVPSWGPFQDQRVSLVFYDGGESLRPLDEHPDAIRRPRGYSCEELGGIAYVLDDDLSTMHRLSVNLPQFISPHGTGSNRYVQCLWTDQRGFTATWQQSQDDLSQPLMLHELSPESVRSILES